MSLISDNEAFKDQIIKKLLDAMPLVEQRVIDEVFKVIDMMDSSGGLFTKGILTADDIIELSMAINQAMVKAGYPQAVNLFMSDFGKVTINTAQLLGSVGGYSFNKVALSGIEKKWMNNTKVSLLDSGIREEFERPILKILDDTISYGSSIDSARSKLVDFVKGGNDSTGKLKSYLTQTARDSVNQLQGQQFQSVANNIETAGVRYVGGLLKDSRGQCTHWVNDLKGFIPWDQLQYEIDLAYKNQAKKLDEPEGHVWGGMMPNTTKDNFLSRRGGFNCRHAAVPVRKKPKG